jgi:tetrahydromethanopterin S-methyltransferase subunit A
MTEEYYPWGGDFTSINPNDSVAVVLLNINFTPNDHVAIYGRLKTENIGIEKIIANVISNPHIRFVVLCGKDIRGHQSGKSLLSLHQNGINDNHRIIDAPGAIPFIENLNEKAIQRFQKQVKVVDLIGETNSEKILEEIKKIAAKNIESFGEPFIAIQLKKISHEEFSDKRALHSKIIVNYMGKIKKRE